MSRNERESVTVHVQQQDLQDTSLLWRSCCVYVDPRVLRFSVQCMLCMTVMSFCIYKLTLHLTCAETQFYTGMITFLTGVFLPAPRI